MSWWTDSLVIVPADGEASLPDISGAPVDNDVEEYATRTFVKPDRVRAAKWKARSFAAMAVRIDGRRWGVLVLDSRDPAGAKKDVLEKVTFTPDVVADIVKAWQG